MRMRAGGVVVGIQLNPDPIACPAALGNQCRQIIIGMFSRVMN